MVGSGGSAVIGTGAVSRRALPATVLLLVASAAALGAAATLDWARVGFQVPLRGTIPVPVPGSAVVPALGSLALLALAAVAAVLATGDWARRLFGLFGLLAAGAPAWGMLAVADQRALIRAATAPARVVPDGTVTVLAAGPALAAAGALLLAGAGTGLVLWGHRMPRMGRRYRVPAARRATAPAASPAGGGQEAQAARGARELWERIDAGEDPTAPGDPGEGVRDRPELASIPGRSRRGRGEA